MAVKFIIDSASDVLPGECKKLDAVHVPMTVRFGDKEFADAVDLSHKKFYKMLTSGKEAHPTTSQVTPAAWTEVMDELLTTHYKVISHRLCIFPYFCVSAMWREVAFK